MNKMTLSIRNANQHQWNIKVFTDVLSDVSHKIIICFCVFEQKVGLTLGIRNKAVTVCDIRMVIKKEFIEIIYWTTSNVCKAVHSILRIKIVKQSDALFRASFRRKKNPFIIPLNPLFALLLVIINTFLIFTVDSLPFINLSVI